MVVVSFGLPGQHGEGNVVNMCVKLEGGDSLVKLLVWLQCSLNAESATIFNKHYKTLISFSSLYFFVFTGLGEVTESLVNDGSLLTADFFADQNESQDVSASEQSTCSNDCLTNPKTVDCNKFKTPLTSRYNHKVSETPCLFSQDESVNHTPTSSEWICLCLKVQVK